METNTDALAHVMGNPLEVMAMMLWQNRIQNPDMAMSISAKDVAAYTQAMGYLAVEPEVRTFRRQDRIFVQLVDAASKVVVRRKVAGKNKEGLDVIVDKDFDLTVVDGQIPLEPGDVIVSIGNGIRPIENNEQDFDAAAKAEAIRTAQAAGARLAQEVKNSAYGGTFSKELVVEVCDALILLTARR